MTRHRAHRSNDGLARLDLGSRLQGLRTSESHHALARGRAMLDARDDLLTDVAALPEADAVQLVVQGVVWKGIAERVIPATLRHTMRDAVRMVDLRLNNAGVADARPVERLRRDRTPAKFRQPGILVNDNRRPDFRSSASPQRRNSMIGRNIRNRGIGPQLVECQPLDEIRRLLPGRFEQIAFVRPDHEKVEQDLALGREEATENGRLLLKPVHVGGYEALKQLRRVGPCYAHHAPISERGNIDGRHASTPILAPRYKMKHWQLGCGCS